MRVPGAAYVAPVERMEGDVSIRLSCEGRMVEVKASSLSQARLRVANVWASLFDGPQREAAAFETAMTLIAEDLP